MAQDDGPSKMADIAKRMGTTPDYAQKYRRRLVNAGVIEVPARGCVAHAAPYLRNCLLREAELD